LIEFLLQLIQLDGALPGEENKESQVPHHGTKEAVEKPYPTQEIGAGPMRREIL
jgi:hypothetical protein